MLKIFVISIVLITLEVIGCRELISYLQPGLFVKALILIPFWAVASITAWYPFAIGIAGGPDSFYKK